MRVAPIQPLQTLQGFANARPRRGRVRTFDDTLWLNRKPIPPIVKRFIDSKGKTK